VHDPERPNLWAAPVLTGYAHLSKNHFQINSNELWTRRALVRYNSRRQRVY